MVRHRHAARHAARGDRQGERRSESRALRCGDAEAHLGAWRQADQGHARRLWQGDQGGNGQVGEGRDPVRRQGGIAMANPSRGPTKAYHNSGFLNSKDARVLRMLAEYLEPKSRFDHHRVEDTVVFMGSARIKSHAEAQELVRQAEGGGGDLEAAQMALRMSTYYEAAREL